MRRGLARLAVVSPLGALFGALAVHGCTIMNGLSVPERDAAVVDAPAEASDPCDHAYPPDDPPSAVEDGDLTFITAVTSIDLGIDGFDAGAGGSPEFPGFDLDRTCTCPAAPSCTNPRAAACDDARGRDNSFATLARGIAAKGLDLQARVSDAISNGASGLLILVESYNGRPDDPRVYVTFTSTPGLKRVLPDGGLSRKEKPTFTKADPWLLDGNQFFEVAGIVQSRRRDIGYIKDGRLTVRIPSARVAFGEEGLVMQVDDAYLIAKVESDGEGSFVVRSGELAGRWPVAAALLSARDVRPADGLDRLCKIPGVLASIKSEVCAAADIAARAEEDGKGRACDAVSVSVTFRGAPAGRGQVYTPPRQEDCPDATPADTECPP